MKILALRTDKPEAELYVYRDGKKLAELKWPAHLKLAETLNAKIDEILNKSSISYGELDGLAVYKGPGSFTGLRIGLSTANALAYGLDLPVAAASGGDWLQTAIQALASGQTDQVALPDYGAAPHITKPKK
ncbi:MAG TPA: tRNA (adenosine(37)-N6)-threonylcarbamoyltransferase complex dimerization subunit type 1 TsaB [Candidatus Saccharimonadales bacterium]|nr:tRNA (adenosine(37)-N6)-threonylcarbamoyltransferase complex dimerization subunit type 1 TsaB [Candidatus Saccharimonadales bacterium]